MRMICHTQISDWGGGSKPPPYGVCGVFLKKGLWRNQTVLSQPHPHLFSFRSSLFSLLWIMIENREKRKVKRCGWFASQISDWNGGSKPPPYGVCGVFPKKQLWKNQTVLSQPLWVPAPPLLISPPSPLSGRRFFLYHKKFCKSIAICFFCAIISHG